MDNQIVAVKVVPIEDDNGDLEREIQYLKECDMRYIVQFLGSFEHTDRLWIMMEYCEGSSLLDVMGATGKCLTQVQVAAALYCCLAALIYLHERNRVHRDVKVGALPHASVRERSGTPMSVPTVLCVCTDTAARPMRVQCASNARPVRVQCASNHCARPMRALSSGGDRVLECGAGWESAAHFRGGRQAG